MRIFFSVASEQDDDGLHISYKTLLLIIKLDRLEDIGEELILTIISEEYALCYTS